MESDAVAEQTVDILRALRPLRQFAHTCLSSDEFQLV